MAIKGIVIASLVSAVCFVSCTNSDKTNSDATTKDTLTNSKENDMKQPWQGNLTHRRMIMGGNSELSE